MSKRVRQISIIALGLAMVLAGIVTFSIGKANAVEASGTFEDTALAWTLTGDGTLTITVTEDADDVGDDYVMVPNLFEFEYIDNVTALVIEDGVKIIDDSAFNCFSKLESVTITTSGSITIRDRAFSGLSYLKTLEINAGGKVYIEEYAFNGATRLESVEITTTANLTYNNTTDYDDDYDYDDDDDEDYDDEESGDADENSGYYSIVLDYYAFRGCSKLSSVTLDGKGVKIGEASFYGATAISTLNIQNADFLNIGADAFYRNKGLTSLTLDATWIEICENAFAYSTSLESIDITCANVYFENKCFKGGEALTSLKVEATADPYFDDGYTGYIAMWYEAFAECTALEEVNLTASNGEYNSADKSNYGYIYIWASFYQNTALKTVNISATDVMLDSYAFYDICDIGDDDIDLNDDEIDDLDCTSGALESFTVTATHDLYLRQYSLCNVYCEESINLTAGNTIYAYNHCFYNMGGPMDMVLKGTYLYGYSGSSISGCPRAFYNCGGMTGTLSVIGDTYSTLSTSYFFASYGKDAISVTSLYFENSYSICLDSYNGDDKLESITIVGGGECEVFADEDFLKDSTAITSVVLEGVEKLYIYSNAFNGATNLATFSGMPITNTIIYAGAFEGTAFADALNLYDEESYAIDALEDTSRISSSYADVHSYFGILDTENSKSDGIVYQIYAAIKAQTILSDFGISTTGCESAELYALRVLNSATSHTITSADFEDVGSVYVTYYDSATGEWVVAEATVSDGSITFSSTSTARLVMIATVADDHTPGDEATCTSPQTCTTCGKVLAEKIDHSYESVVTAPTCTEGGYTTYTCSVCKGSYVGDATEAKGHSLSSTVTAATCEEGGYTTYSCANCDYYYKDDYTTATGHTWVAGTTVDATCTTEGYTSYTCRDCSSTKDDDVEEALGHDLVLDTEGSVDATCYAEGSTKYSCSRCDYYVTEGVAVKAHTYDDGAVTKSATCTDAGVLTYTCTVEGCGHFYTEAIDALGHSYTGVVTTEATATAAGVMTYTCTNSGCSDSYTVAIPATGVKSESSTVVADSENSVITYGDTTLTTTTDENVTASVVVDIANVLDSIDINMEEETKLLVELVLSISETVESKIEETVVAEIIEAVIEEVTNAVSSAVTGALTGSTSSSSSTAAVTAEDITVAYLDITFDAIINQLGSSTEGQVTTSITELDEPIQITVAIPEDMSKTVGSATGTYYIVRVHEGEVDILDATYDATKGTLTFETDRFSTYAIVFVDETPTPAASDNGTTTTTTTGTTGTTDTTGTTGTTGTTDTTDTTTSPKTADAALPVVGAAVILLCLGVVLYVNRRRFEV